MSLSAQVGALEAQLKLAQAEVAYLRELLTDCEPEAPEVALMVRYRLTPGEAAVLLKLAGAKGRVVDRLTIEAAVPARDHVADRNPKIVDVLICRLRKKIGPGVVQTVERMGWRINPNWKG